MKVKVFSKCIAKPRRGKVEVWKDNEGRYCDKVSSDRVIVEYIGFGKTLVIEDDNHIAVINKDDCYVIEMEKDIYYKIRGVFNDLGLNVEKFDELVIKEDEYEEIEIDKLDDITQYLK